MDGPLHDVTEPQLLAQKLTPLLSSQDSSPEDALTAIRRARKTQMRRMVIFFFLGGTSHMTSTEAGMRASSREKLLA